MSDLISRSALLEAMDKRYNEKQGIVPNNLAEGFMQMEKLIKEQPIAYDKEAVVEQLEAREQYLETAMKESYKKGYVFSEQKAMNEMVAIKYAIGIVKAGGIDG